MSNFTTPLFAAIFSYLPHAHRLDHSRTKQPTKEQPQINQQPKPTETLPKPTEIKIRNHQTTSPQSHGYLYPPFLERSWPWGRVGGLISHKSSVVAWQRQICSEEVPKGYENVGSARSLRTIVYLHNMQSRYAVEERHGLGVDVCLTKEHLELCPECPHGKMLGLAMV